MVTFASKSIHKHISGNGDHRLSQSGKCRSVKIVSAMLIGAAKTSSILFLKNGAASKILPGMVVNFIIHSGEEAVISLSGMPEGSSVKLILLASYDRGEESYFSIGDSEIKLNDASEPKSPVDGFVPQQPHWLKPEINKKEDKKDEVKHEEKTEKPEENKKKNKPSKKKATSEKSGEKPDSEKKPEEKVETKKSKVAAKKKSAPKED